MRKESIGRFMWDEGESTIEFPDKEEKKIKAQDFNAIKDKKKELKKDEKEQ